ncbi:hypothetical protein [Burkholderia vietnamiensis]|uniref:hypothetical protein n=1 Tax=Burkholderia vietnamiensis TaxID=60552 RepID=UPI0039B5AB0F
MDTAILAHFQRFDPTELDKVPASPGVYAWYAKPQIGAADWSKALDHNGDDIGEATLRSLLAKHTSRFAPISLRVRAHHAFRDSWAGRLTSATFDRHVSALNKKDFQEEEEKLLRLPKASMQKVLSSETQRGRLSKLITEVAAPLLSSPVYIGKSDDLRRRISEHVANLGKWHILVQRNSIYREKMRDALFGGDRNYSVPDEFSTRAIAAGFSPDNLEIYVLNIAEALGVSNNLALELAETLEWLLNTWHRPILGRA